MDRVNRRNYYRLLHVQHDAPTEVIKASYRTIMQKLKQHPDLGGDAWNASLLNEAYTTLCDTEKRASYDKQLGKVRTERQTNPSHARTPSKKQERSPQRQYGPAHCPFCQVSAPGKTLAGTALTYCRVCDSPLTPVKETVSNVKSKRAVKRTSVIGQLHFVSSWPQTTTETGKIQNLSPKGLKFTYANKLQVNSLIKIDSQGLKAVGRIVSCLDPSNQPGSGFSIGVEFITLSFHDIRDVEYS